MYKNLLIYNSKNEFKDTLISSNENGEKPKKVYFLSHIFFNPLIQSNFLSAKKTGMNERKHRHQ